MMYFIYEFTESCCKVSVMHVNVSTNGFSLYLCGNYVGAIGTALINVYASLCFCLYLAFLVLSQIERVAAGVCRLKLGDFGLAMVVTEPVFTICGTPTYVAPEILCETG